MLTVIIPTVSTPPTFPYGVSAVKAAAAAVNAKGGINGKQIEIKVCNENNNPNDAVKCARQAVANHSVAVVGSFSTSGHQITQTLSKAGIPLVGFNPITPADYACATCYGFDAGSTLAFAGLPGALRASGAKTVTTLSLDLASAAANVAAVEQAAKAAGLRTAAVVKVGATSTDLAPAVQAVVQSRADAAVSVLPAEQTLAFIKAADQARAPFTFGVVDGQIQSVLSQIHGSQDDHLLVVGAYPPLDATARYPGLKQFAAELDAQGRTGDKDAATRDSSSVRAWLSVHAVAQVAAGITGDITSTSLNDAFKTAKNIDLYGIQPAWTPSAKGHVPGFERVSNARVFFMRLSDGKFSEAKPIAGIDLNAGKPF
ncbi:ABC transporter substrate-binding protein [Frankia canadensis]|uniref:ABC transporter substrate-binding protein n=1 Tax=Frankia canadensis TaxID=1836972 RepID=UPI0014023CA1|nr:ABC transporter substrate-binding protein [Frankia canadensis]